MPRLVLEGDTSAAQSGLISPADALAAVFPGAGIAAGRHFPTHGQVEWIEALSGTEVASKIYARYVACRGGVVVAGPTLKLRSYAPRGRVC